MLSAYQHRGWRITEDRRAQPGARFKATRWGVSIVASGELTLCRMIELRWDS